MRRLVISTSSAACSIALLDGDDVAARLHETVGRGHAERLVPMIAGLPGGGRADAVLVDVGPGSFTGVRVGLAAARALALAWRVPVHGVSATALIAAAAFAADPALDALAVALAGGHGELFVEGFAGTPLAVTLPLASLPPAAALATIGALPVFGSGAAALGSGVPALPDAADARLLPAAFAALAPSPIYGRAPDATPPGGVARA